MSKIIKYKNIFDGEELELTQCQRITKTKVILREFFRENEGIHILLIKDNGNNVVSLISGNSLSIKVFIKNELYYQYYVLYNLKEVDNDLAQIILDNDIDPCNLMDQVEYYKVE